MFNFLCKQKSANQIAATQSFFRCGKADLLKLTARIRMGKEKKISTRKIFLYFWYFTASCDTQRASPWGSRMRGMLSSLSARRKASSRFSWLLLDPARERSTSCGLREHKMARKASPLLQLDPKSLTLTEQATLGERRAQRTSLVGIVATAKCQKSYLINFLKVQCVIFVQIYDLKAQYTAHKHIDKSV